MTVARHSPAPVVAVVIPCFRVRRHILGVLAGIGPEVAQIWVIDDACPEATGALVLAESHLAIHTWPEMDAATFDLYVCNHSRDNRAAAEAAFVMLQQAFQPQRVVRRDITRGEIQAAVPAPGP